MSQLDDAARVESLTVLSGFRAEFYDCLAARADALFEPADALLCAGGPVRALVDQSLEAEHRRGHGAWYDGLNSGRLEMARFRRAIASLPSPRPAGGRIVLAVNVSPWLRPDAATSPGRAFCHVRGRARNQAQMIPWPAVLVRSRVGDRPDLLDGGAGRSAARPCRRRHRRHRRATPPGHRTSDGSRAMAAWRSGA